MTTTAIKRRTTKRRGNGEGSIFQRADGRWCAVFNAGYKPDGKRHRKHVYGETKRDVQEQLTRLQSRKLDGTLTDSARLTVSAFLAKWLENSAKPSVRATTYDNYKRSVEKHINLAIGGLQLAKLTPADVQGVYGKMEADGASAYTRRTAHAVLHRAFKQALKWGLVIRNVCDAVDPPRLPHSDIHPLTADEAKTLLTTAKGDRLEAIYVLAVHTGMRLGELLGLQWEDVNFEGRCINIRHALQDLGGKRILDRATELKITLFRDGDEVAGGFELHGHLGSDDEELFGGAAQAEDLSFISELIRRFQEKVKD